MEIASAATIALSSQPFPIAAIVTFLCFLLALFAAVHIRRAKALQSVGEGGLSDSLVGARNCDCTCSLNGGVVIGGSDPRASITSSARTSMPYLNGRVVEVLEKAPVVVTERQTGASMMEQLVPEITTHALSYLDYPSLCRLSMTNSLMRKAANDDNAWKALYHKDFTLEQDTVTPTNGWKAYYAATRTIMNVNAQFFNIVRERSLQAMSHFWLNADYVKCIHASGEFFSGYNAVIQSWQLAFNWEQGINFQVRDARARVLSDMAWVSMKTYVDMDTGPFNVTNIYEFHNGRWYMVHHHSSVMLIDGEVEQQMVQG
ncbi:F-box protein SKIP8-like [Momordica charantia]|uniref:F-box protein SKIP8-like n=1 Tax=Momordica charantia TaxID=3673 RepID=A0A6J1C3C3_MOMCH|nr:F-box protein SKIP8-like [Momordica charantia]